MKCLILAAGYGSRLRELGDSKPLVPVGGLPLIEHVLCGAAEAGIRDFVVVTGHLSDRLEPFLAAAASRLGLSIEAVRLTDWDRPNGFSVIAGAERAGDDYLLLMSDHLFDPAILRRLVAAPRPEGVRLVVDRNTGSPLTDLDDATRVDVGPDGAIRRIGKQIAGFNAVDTGIFRATPALPAAIAEAAAAGRSGSLSDGVQRLADQGRAATMDVGHGWWIDVDDARAHALAEAELRRQPAIQASCGKVATGFPQ